MGLWLGAWTGWLAGWLGSALTRVTSLSAGVGFKHGPLCAGRRLLRILGAVWGAGRGLVGATVVAVGGVCVRVVWVVWVVGGLLSGWIIGWQVTGWVAGWVDGWL